MSRSSRGLISSCLTLVCCITAIAAYSAPHSGTEKTAHGLNELPQRRSYAPEALQHPLHSVILEDVDLLPQPADTQPLPAHAPHSLQETIQPLKRDMNTAESRRRSENQGRRSAGVRFQSRRQLQQGGELHSRGKGDNSWRKDPELEEEQRDQDILAAAASKSDKVLQQRLLSLHLALPGVKYQACSHLSRTDDFVKDR